MERTKAENMETQLLESIEEESVGRDNEIEVLEPSVSHIYSYAFASALSVRCLILFCVVL